MSNEALRQACEAFYVQFVVNFCKNQRPEAVDQEIDDLFRFAKQQQAAGMRKVRDRVRQGKPHAYLATDLWIAEWCEDTARELEEGEE